MNPSNRIHSRTKVNFEGVNNGNPKESQSKIPRRLSSRSLSLPRISDVKRYSSQESSRMIRSKSTLGATPLNKFKSTNPHQLFPPQFSECSDRLIPSPTSSRKQPGGSASKNSVQRSKDVDTRPFNDKKWQQAQLQKIQQYLQRNESKNTNDGYSLRPLSINTFIEICNLLFKKLDSKLIITKENYVEELPFILRSLGYPSSQNLKKSLMKAVNIPRNWPMALGILSWIVELIEDFDCLDYESYVPNKKKIVANAIFDWYKKRSQNTELDVSVLIEQVYDQLIESENLTIDDFNDVKKQIEESETKFENVCHEENKLLEIQSDYANKRALIKTMEQKILVNEDLKRKKINTIKKLKIDLNENEYIIGNLSKEKESLLKTIKTQCVDKEEYLKTLNDCAELEQDIASFTKLIDNLMECTYMEMQKMKRKHERIVELREEFNKKCLSNITELNSFEVCFDIALTNPDTHYILVDLTKRMLKTLEEQEQESEKLDLEAMELAELNRKMDQLNIVHNQEIPELKHGIEILREKIDKNRKMIQNYQFEIEKHMKQLKEYESKIAAVETQQTLMISESEKLFEKMEEQYFAYGNAAAARLEGIYDNLDDLVNKLNVFLPE